MITWIINILILGLILYLTMRYIPSKLGQMTFALSLCLRIGAGIAVGWVFTKMYAGADTIYYYNVASDALERDSLWSIITGSVDNDYSSNQPRVWFFIQVLSVILVLSGGSYWLASIYFSIFAFAASWYFVNKHIQVFPDHRFITIASFLFIPTILFWSSGIQKGTLILGCLSILIAQIIQLAYKRRLKPLEWISTAVSCLILLKISHYMFVIFLLFTGLTIGFHLFNNLRGIRKIIYPIISIVLFFSITQFVHPYFQIDRLPQTIYENNKAISDKSEPEKRLGVILEEPTWANIFSELPNAIITGLARPSFFDETASTGIIHKIENLVILSLLMFTSILLFKDRPTVDWPIVLPAGFCVILLAALLALSTPNFGSLVRYTNAFKPFLLLLVGILPFRYLTSTRE